MNKEPLKDKSAILINGNKSRFIPAHHIESAVEWLRSELCMRRGCKYYNEKSTIKVQVFSNKCTTCEIIDEAFQDVTKK